MLFTLFIATLCFMYVAFVILLTMFTIATLPYYLLKTVWMWFFYLHKPEETYLEWWKKVTYETRSLIFNIDSATIISDEDECRIPKMKFVQITEPFVTLERGDEVLSKYWFTPFFALSMITIPFYLQREFGMVRPDYIENAYMIFCNAVGPVMLVCWLFVLFYKFVLWLWDSCQSLAALFLFLGFIKSRRR